MFYVLATGGHGRRCQRICRPRARSIRVVGLAPHPGADPRGPSMSPREAAGRKKSNGGDYQLAKRQGRSKRGVAPDPQGFDAGKKVTGRKRHIVVDMIGLLRGVSVLAADIQDRGRSVQRVGAFSSSNASLPTPDSRVENGHDDRRHGLLDDRDRQALPISIVSRPCRTDRSSRGPSPGSAAIDN